MDVVAGNGNAARSARRSGGTNRICFASRGEAFNLVEQVQVVVEAGGVAGGHVGHFRDLEVPGKFLNVFSKINMRQPRLFP